jgi:hypothetical protein
MYQVETPGGFTRLEHVQLEFLDHLPEEIFSLRNLRNPGRM